MEYFRCSRGHARGFLTVFLAATERLLGHAVQNEAPECDQLPMGWGETVD